MRNPKLSDSVTKLKLSNRAFCIFCYMQETMIARAIMGSVATVSGARTLMNVRILKLALT